MNLDKQTYHSIDAYLNGELHGRKLDRFKADLKTNKNLQESVVIQEKIIKAINSEREKKLKDYLTENTRKKAVKPAQMYETWMLTAAAIAILVSAVVILIPNISTPYKKNTSSISTPEKKKTTDSEIYEPSPSLLEEIETVMEDTQTMASATIPDVTDNIEPADEIILLETESESADQLDEPDTDDFINSVSEKDTSTDAFKNSQTIAKNTLSDQPIPLLKSAEIEILGDELLASKHYILPSIETELSVNTTRLDEKQTESTSREKKEVDKNTSTVEEDIIITNAANSRGIEVEYWKSVVNYKGYQYNGSKIKLYGIDQTKTLNFRELDNRLYLKLEGRQYYLEKNTKYNRLVDVTNPTLLKVLND
jgi:hypothetical protein